MPKPKAFVRWFPASARSYMEQEIAHLIRDIPTLPEFALDRLHTGDCFVLVDVTTSPHPTNYTHSDDQPRDPEKA